MTAKELNAIAAQLAAQVATKRRKSADVVPPGWFTATAIAKQNRMSPSNVRKQLVEIGAEKRFFSVIVRSDGKLQSIPHYKLK